MEKLIALALTKQGLLYGLLVGIMKVMKDVRDGKVKAATAITDIVGAMIVGHVAYEVAGETDVSKYLQILWTLFMSANAFLVIAVATDKKFFDEVLKKYIKKI